LTVARAAAAGALLLAVGVIAAVLLRGPEAGRYVIYFQNAGQLVKGDDVQVGGRRVGSVDDIVLTDDNQAKILVQVEKPYAPLRRGTRAVIRQTSLSGIANRYIALSPGPDSAERIDDGGALTAEATTTPVDLDQLFNTFDPDARRDLQDVIRGFATQYEGKGAQANAAARYFNPALSSTRRLAEELNRDSGALARFLVNSSKAMSALAERRDDLSGLVSNSNAVASAVAQEDASLSAALQRLPGTLRKGNTTFVNLRAALTDLDALVAESKPATRRLAPFLRELRPLLAEARPTVRDLRTLVRRAGGGNDLLDATQRLPGFERSARTAFENSRAALLRSQPVFEFGRPYTPDLVGFLRDFGETTAAYDANGHYARIQPIFDAFRFRDDENGGSLEPVPANQRFDQLQTGILRRCPGSATQPPADGSAPYTDGGTLSREDCDPDARVPGP
jgi:phospholipid/cholesterol/gamma-HCH transport system substrate-binding protein